MTLKGWTRTEILDLEDDERKKWADQCREHQEQLKRAARRK
jgi:hypothetical protein